jgi:predicted MFS family arabinose efflux permease
MEQRRQVPVLALALGVSTVGSLPVFLIGALAGEIIPALGVTESGIGQLVALYFAVSAVMSYFAGRVVNRLGWLRSLLVTAGIVVLLGAGVFAAPPSAFALAGALFLGGLANGISHPAANLALVRSIDPSRQGVAFGVKQAAIPTGTLLSGAALPIIAVPFGWQAAFLALAILAAIVLADGLWLTRQVQRAEGSVRGRPEATYDRTHLWYLAAGAGLGAGASNSVGAFFVLHALDVGVNVGTAGLLLALGGITNIVARLVLGWQADRRASGHLQRVSMMMVGGAVGVLLLAVADGLVVLAIGTVLAFGVGWGYNGLLHLGTMRLYGHAAASVTGVMQAAQFVGAVAGPLTVGFLVERVSFLAAWMMVALWLVLAGLFVWRFRILWIRRAAGAASPGAAASDPSATR